jgi:NADH:ubiquinone oxidoreductase subunit F (NADH-binding)
MILAARSIGAQRGWVFIRHEYEQERARIALAIDEAYAAGVLGEKVCGSDFSFELEIFTSPGGYILGEETALLEALEGRRGEPRNRPPYPAQQGLWGKPTLLNNVETLAHIPRIVRSGAAAFRFFSVSGDVERPGVYEVPASTTIRELIDRCGGMRDGAELAAFMAGGMSGGFLPAEQCDISLDWNAPDGVRGVGGVVIMAEGRDLLDLAENVVAFFRNESCGKCVPCRLGTEKALQLLARGEPADFEMIEELNETLRATSLCGLGQVALSPVTTLLSHFPELAKSGS